MDLELPIKIVSWGSGVILENGIEVGKVRIEPKGLTEEQRKAFEKIRGDHQETKTGR